MNHHFLGKACIYTGFFLLPLTHAVIEEKSHRAVLCQQSDKGMSVETKWWMEMLPPSFGDPWCWLRIMISGKDYFFLKVGKNVSQRPSNLLVEIWHTESTHKCIILYIFTNWTYPLNQSRCKGVPAPQKTPSLALPAITFIPRATAIPLSSSRDDFSLC